MARELFEDKQYLSLSGGSGMSIKDMMDCPMKFKHRKDGWVLKKKPIYFMSGSLFHNMSEAILQGSKEYSSVEKVQKVVEEALAEGKLYNEWRDEYEE